MAMTKEGRDMDAEARIIDLARTAGRLLINWFLIVLYSVGFFAGGIVTVCAGSAAAVRLGWSDVRKRGTRGDA
jgi:hypothetical protein